MHKCYNIDENGHVFVYEAFKVIFFGFKFAEMVIKCDSMIKGKVLKLGWSCGITMLDSFLVEIWAQCIYLL